MRNPSGIYCVRDSFNILIWRGRANDAKQALQLAPHRVQPRRAHRVLRDASNTDHSSYFYDESLHGKLS